MKKYRMKILLIFLIVFCGIIDALATTKFPLKNGEKVQIETNIINTNLKNGFRSKILQGYVAGHEGNILYICSKGDIIIDRITNFDGSIVEYPFVGAKYEAKSKLFSGIDKNGNQTSVQLADIDFVDVTLIVKGKHIPTIFYANTLHDRLRSVSSYPELLYKVQLDSITKIKKWKKANSSAIALGALAGGVVGYLYGSQTEKDDKPTPDWFDAEYSRETKIGVDVVLGIFTGASVGYLIGKSKWQSVSIKKLNLSVKSISNRGFGLNLAVKL
jgi:hypothetical protein